MAETLLSPGVLARENDQSQVTSQPVQAGAAILGPTVKGPAGIPTMVTSYSEYVNTYGTTFVSGSTDVKSFLTSISAYNYFNNGGTSLLVTRITSGSFTQATSSVTNSTTTEGGKFTSGSFTINEEFTDGREVRVTFPDSTLYRFVASGNPVPEDDVDGKLYFFSTGSTATETATNLGADLNTALDGIFTINTASADVEFTASAFGTTYNTTTVATGSGATFTTQTTLGGGVIATGTGVAFQLNTFSEGIILNSTSTEDDNGALESGSSDNIRYEITSNNVAQGSFDLVIRRGNDVTNEKLVLETWPNLSLDPKADNYISKVIGDTYYIVDTSDTTPYVKPVGTYLPKSNYVYVSSITNTPDYFDNAGNAKSAFSSSLPDVASGSFGGATGDIIAGSDLYYENITGDDNIQGVRAADYTQSINLLGNQDEYIFNSITAPGLIIGQATSTITSLINMVQTRGDALAVVDPAVYGATLSTMTGNAATYNSSYAATYAPWLQTTDPESGQIVWVPSSTMIPGVYAYNDSVSEAWFAPAGLNRGGLATVVRPERKLSQANRDTLYTGNVNPIASFPSAGTVVFGQKTLQKKASALDRINVRRLLIELKSYISQVSDNLVFEQNTIATRNTFLSQVNPYLESVQQRQGLYAFRVIMDDSNNTADVIDRNQLIGQIYLQPTKTAEFIYLDFNILPTGATFPA